MHTGLYQFIAAGYLFLYCYKHTSFYLNLRRVCAHSCYTALFRITIMVSSSVR